MAISLGVGNSTSAVGSATTLVQTTGLATTAGRLLVCIITCNNSQTISSLSDTAGNSFTDCAVDSSVSGSGRVGIWYAKNITANAANKVTVNYSASTNVRRMFVQEVVGIDTVTPFDIGDGANTGSGTSMTTNSVATSRPNEILFGGINGNTTFVAGSGYTIAELSGAGWEYKIVSAAGSYVADATQASGSWAISIATFKGATQPLLVGARSLFVGSPSINKFGGTR